MSYYFLNCDDNTIDMLAEDKGLVIWRLHIEIFTSEII